MNNENILTIKDLSISFETQNGSVHAITDLSLELKRGQTLAIVGESGSGKSVTAKAVMGILSSNGKIEGGSIDFNYLDKNTDTYKNFDLVGLTKREYRNSVNGKLISMVFQDPMTSLDPTMSIGKQLMEGMIWHRKISKAEARKEACRLLELVDIADPEKRLKNYPHQLSGGMRQRIVIAIALANNPQLLICDEPTTALDVTVQSKILELIKDIQEKMKISVIYITHDLGVVARVADFVNVMYAGRIVETGSCEEIFYDPRHPYTWGLLSAMPSLDMESDYLYTIPGSPPNLLNKPEGDAFAPRNAFALNIDKRLPPPMFKVSDTHYAATWLLDKRAPKVEVPEALKSRLRNVYEEVNGVESH
jgi:oligopeptide transport system ATP-binding protein